MVKIETIKQKLQQILSERRYRHSLGVADEAKKLALHYGADTEKAYLAGLVHDCAKEIPPARMQELMIHRYGVPVDAQMAHMPRLLHGPLGACVAQSEFEIYDPEILDAIRFHTTGKAGMQLLTKIIYIADYIEPNRDFEGVEALRQLAYQDIDSAILKGVDFTICDLVERGLILHIDTVHARNDLILHRAD